MTPKCKVSGDLVVNLIDKCKCSHLVSKTLMAACKNPRWHVEHGNLAPSSWVEGFTGNNEDPGKPGGQILLHFVMKIAREGRLQLSDCGNQERYSQDGNSAANLTCVMVSELGTQYAQTHCKHAIVKY